MMMRIKSAFFNSDKEWNSTHHFQAIVLKERKAFPIKTILFLICFALQPQLKSQPLADGQSKFLGNVIGDDGYNIPSNFDSYWNQVTPENSGKWGSAESVRGTMQWGGLDRIHDYAKNRDFPFKQHNFVWGQQQPGWIKSLSSDDQKAEVEEWMQLFGERYPDTDFIDVVNEPLHAPPIYKNALGGDGATGWDWVIWCFEKARFYNHDAKLHINEYGVINDNNMTTQYLKIINLLKDRGLIDGIGEQGHFFETAGIGTLTSNLNRLADTGLPIYITEYDVRIADDTQQLNKYKEQFPLFWEHPGVQGVTLWGYIEGKIWRKEAFLIRSDGSERPALQWLREYMEERVTSVKEKVSPRDYSLFQNYPNPFNPETRIRFKLDETSDVRLEVYDLSGRKISTLLKDRLPAGFHQIRWDASDESGKRVSCGVYVYRIAVTFPGGTYTVSKKMTLLK
jgi:endo-1,4-beta-xylanase